MKTKNREENTAFLAKGCLLATAALLFLPSHAAAWGTGHRIITAAAWEVQPEALRQRWSAPHHNAFHEREESIAWYLTRFFCMHADWVDGPTRNEEDIPERLRITAYLYAEKEGRFYPPVAYTDPERESKRPLPKTYHYFTSRREEVNRAFALRGSRWYFEKIREAFRENRDSDAAEYAGAFAHAIQDRVSPGHIWDGYIDEREALEDSLAAHGLQTPEGSRRQKPANNSIFWTLNESGMSADLGDYRPRLLGKTPEEAAEAFTERLFASHRHAKAVFTDRDGFVRSHLADDWLALVAGPETNRYLSQVAAENARLVADVFFTAHALSLEALEAPE